MRLEVCTDYKPLLILFLAISDLRKSDGPRRVVIYFTLLPRGKIMKIYVKIVVVFATK